MIKRINVFLFILFWMFSCNSKENNPVKNFDINQQYVIKQINPILDLNKTCYTNITILPGSGCTGCITKAETFFKNNLYNSKFFFILTDLQSLKILNHKLGVSIQNLENVYIDYEKSFQNYEYSIYPVYLTLNCKSKTITNVEFQKPK